MHLPLCTYHHCTPTIVHLPPLCTYHCAPTTIVHLPLGTYHHCAPTIAHLPPLCTYHYCAQTTNYHCAPSQNSNFRCIHFRLHWFWCIVIVHQPVSQVKVRERTKDIPPGGSRSELGKGTQNRFLNGPGIIYY